MLIIPYVCADFRDKSGNTIFRITPDMIRTMQEVPEAIKQDLLFDMLVVDGSIKTPETAAQRKLLEQEPMLGMTADGRSAVNASGVHEGGAEVSRNERAVRGTVATIEAAEKSVKAEKPAKPAKAETKADEKPAETKQEIKPAGTAEKK